MNKLERCRKAKEYHDKGFNCAQSVLEAFRDKVGLTEEQCCGIATGLGGGFRSGNICGAASGAVLVLGMLHPHATENDPERKAYTAKLTKELLRRFSERFQNLLDCRDLLQAKDLQGVEEVTALGAAKHCETLIISAVAILYDYLEELEEE